jgi:hypothetical protein
MAEKESALVLRRVVPLPIALYDSNGLLFELFDGGQPLRRHQIVWKRLEPTGGQAPATFSGERSRD